MSDKRVKVVVTVTVEDDGAEDLGGELSKWALKAVLELDVREALRELHYAPQEVNVRVRKVSRL